jgi:hypothetical protein
LVTTKAILLVLYFKIFSITSSGVLSIVMRD